MWLQRKDGQITDCYYVTCRLFIQDQVYKIMSDISFYPLTYLIKSSPMELLQCKTIGVYMSSHRLVRDMITSLLLLSCQLSISVLFIPELSM